MLILLNVQLIGSSKYWDVERLGRSIFPPLHYFLTFQFIYQSFGINHSYTVSEHLSQGEIRVNKHLAK